MANPNPLTDYPALRRAGKLHGTIQRARALHTARLQARWIAPADAMKILIPLSASDSDKAATAARTAFPRRRNWTNPAAGLAPNNNWQPRDVWVVDIDCGTYSRGCKYTRWEYQPRMASFGAVTRTRLYARIGADPFLHRAPKGWLFGTDVLGIYIRRAKEIREGFRYHLDSGDIRGGASAMRRAGMEHEARQRTVARGAPVTRSMQKLLDTVGVWVSLSDSAAAGNCLSGTRTWCAAHGIDYRRHVRVAVIQRLLGEHPSVQRVIDVATARTAADIKRGFCTI
jgi:hypothetical protein